MSVDATVCPDAGAFGGMPLGRRYWLRRCEGFRVEGPDGRIGFVEEARLDGWAGEPVELVVHGCMPGGGRVVVPVSEVAEVLPREERILLRSAAAVRPAGLAGVSPRSTGASEQVSRGVR